MSNLTAKIQISKSAKIALSSIAANSDQFQHWPTVLYALLARSIKIASAKPLGQPAYTGVSFGFRGAELLIASRQKKSTDPLGKYNILITGHAAEGGIMERRIELEPRNGTDFQKIPSDQSIQYPIADADVLRQVEALHAQNNKNYPLPQEVAAELILRQDEPFAEAAGWALENHPFYFNLRTQAKACTLTTSRGILGQELSRAASAMDAQD